MLALLAATRASSAKFLSSTSSSSTSSTSTLRRSVLVLNAGSSSLKLKLFEEGDKEADELVPVASALVERLGTEGATLRSWRRRTKEEGGEEEEQKLGAASPVAARDVRAALASALPHLGLSSASASELTAVGNRIVHGGGLSRSREWRDAETQRAVASATALAPLHNPANAAGARAALELFPRATHVAVFDTAFHVESMEADAFTYALPASMRALGGGGGGGGEGGGGEARSLFAEGSLLAESVTVRGALLSSSSSLASSLASSSRSRRRRCRRLSAPEALSELEAALASEGIRAVRQLCASSAPLHLPLPFPEDLLPRWCYERSGGRSSGKDGEEEGEGLGGAPLLVRLAASRALSSLARDSADLLTLGGAGGEKSSSSAAAAAAAHASGLRSSRAGRGEGSAGSLAGSLLPLFNSWGVDSEDAAASAESSRELESEYRGGGSDGVLSSGDDSDEG